jgi:AraC-like DNA-binding protein
MTRRRTWTNSLVERSTLAVWLTPTESASVSPQLLDRVTVLEVQNFSELADVLANDHAHAVLVSAARLDTSAIDQLTLVRRTLPRMPFLGLVTEEASDGIDWRMATLGRLGADTVADLRSREGWRALRQAVDRLPTPLVRRALAVVSEALGGRGTDGWYRFVAAAFRGNAVTVKQLGRAEAVDPRQLDVYFLHARLPSPKQYIEIGLLARVAYFSELTSWGVAAISRAAGISSPQALHLAIRRLTGLTPGEWRRGHGVAWVLDEFRDHYVMPYRSVLETFNPYAKRWVRPRPRLLARESILWGHSNDRVRAAR